jgi:hypothetical protein
MRRALRFKLTTQGRRLMVVRIFASHLQALDPATEIQPDDLLPHHYRRIAPYLYSPGEITALMAAAGRLGTLRDLARVIWRTASGAHADADARPTLERMAAQLASRGELTFAQERAEQPDAQDDAGERVGDDQQRLGHVQRARRVAQPAGAPCR